MKKLILLIFCAVFFASCAGQNSQEEDKNYSKLHNDWRKEHIKLKKDEKLEIHKKYCQKGLEEGCAEAINAEIKLAKDDEEKLKIYEKYCESGVSQGCHQAGFLLIKINPSQKALNLVSKACELGNEKACEDLAQSYDRNGDNSIFQRSLNIAYEPSKVQYYLKKMCDKGEECKKYYDFCNGTSTYLWLKENDISSFIDIDEAVRIDISKHKICGDICNKDAGLWYTKGAFGNDGFRRTGVGRNLSKADFYFKKIKNFEQSVFHEIFEALKKSQNEELIREAIKEFCDKGDKVACEFYDERYKE